MDSGTTNFMIFAILIILLMLIFVFSNRATDVIKETDDDDDNNSDVGKDSTIFKPAVVKRDTANLGDTVNVFYNSAVSVKNKITGNDSDRNDRNVRASDRAGNRAGNRTNDNNNASKNDKTTFTPYALTTPVPRSSTAPYNQVTSTLSSTLSSITKTNTQFGGYSTTPTPTSMTTPSNAFSVTPTILSTAISPYRYLGEATSMDFVNANQNKILMANSDIRLNIGMYIKVKNSYYKISNIENAVDSRSGRAFFVYLDNDLTDSINKDNRLSIYFKTSSDNITTTPAYSNSTTPQNTYSNNRTTLTPLGKMYVLHLSKKSKINGDLIFTPYSDVTSDELKYISSMLNHSTESFTSDGTTDLGSDITALDQDEGEFETTPGPEEGEFETTMDSGEFETTPAPEEGEFETTMDSGEFETTPGPEEGEFETTMGSGEFETTMGSGEFETTMGSSVFETTMGSGEDEFETTMGSGEDEFETTMGSGEDEFETTMGSSVFETTPTFVKTSTFPPATTLPDFNSCATKYSSIETTTKRASTKNSVLYITDCLNYPVNASVFRNNSLIIKLKTDDDRTIESGYYKLVL